MRVTPRNPRLRARPSRALAERRLGRLDEGAVPLGQLEQAVEDLLWSDAAAAVLGHQRRHRLRRRPGSAQRAARRVAALDLVAQRGAQPVVVGGREAVLGASGDAGRQQPLHRHAVQALAGARAHARAAGMRSTKRISSTSRKGTRSSRLGRHRHLVVADAGCRRAGTCACRGRAPARAGCGLVRRRARRAPARVALLLGLGARLAEQRRADGGVGDLDQAQQPLGVAPAADQVRGPPRAGGARQRAGHRGGGRGERRRRGAQRRQQRRRLVAAVAAVGLVGALAGEHHLHLLGGEARQLAQRAAPTGSRRAPRGGEWPAASSARKSVSCMAVSWCVGADQPGALGRRAALVEQPAVAGEADREGGGRPAAARVAMAATTAAESTPPERKAP